MIQYYVFNMITDILVWLWSIFFLLVGMLKLVSLCCKWYRICKLADNNTNRLPQFCEVGKGNTGGSLYKYLTESHHIHDWRIPKFGNLNLTKKTTFSHIQSHSSNNLPVIFAPESLQKTSFFSKFHPFFIWRKTTSSLQSWPNHQALVHEAVSFRSPPRSVLATWKGTDDARFGVRR